MEGEKQTFSVAALRKSMLYRLASFGGIAWETPRMNNGMPTVHYVWDSQYYGFYPVPPGAGNTRLKPFERRFMKRLIDSGAICAAVSSIEQMEEAMNMDAMWREKKNCLPRKEIVGMLRKWGKGQQNNDLQIQILALDKTHRDLIYNVYFDRRTFNQLADEEGVAYTTITSRHQRAINAIREGLLKRQNLAK
jgi:hypothetical protein